MALDSDDKAFVLKNKLRDLVNIIVESDDYTVDTAEEAITTLSALKNLKFDVTVPPQFQCPISGTLMTDPVVLCTGQTYDRCFIEKWLNEFHRTCPVTQKVLFNCTLIPNTLVQQMISQWCKENGIQPPKPAGAVDEDNNTDAEEVTDDHIDHLNSLLLNLALSVSDQKQAAKELRQLTKQIHSIRIVLSNSDLIEKLLRPLAGTANIDPQLYEDLITTIHNLSLHNDNKKILGENERVISILIDSLKFGTGATVQTRSNAAAAFCSLSALDSNKSIIGKAGAIKYLVFLLEEKNENPLAIKDAASAIFNLCIANDENKESTIREGTIQILINKIMDQILVDELLSLMALLSSHSMGVEVLANLGAVPFLLGIIKDGMSDCSKENCIAILYAIYRSDRRKWLETFRSYELSKTTLSKLELYGTPRAKKKASSILRRLHPPSSSKIPAT